MNDVSFESLALFSNVSTLEAVFNENDQCLVRFRVESKAKTHRNVYVFKRP